MSDRFVGVATDEPEADGRMKAKLLTDEEVDEMLESVDKEDDEDDEDDED